MSLINTAQVKKRALAYAQRRDAERWSRVSAVFLRRIERRLDDLLRQEVNDQPSVGRTLK